jgi:hypothetical protein
VEHQIMPVRVVSRSETLDQVITKAHGTLSAAQLKALRTATLAANPHLTEGATLVPGTVVVVPPRVQDTPSTTEPEPVSGSVVTTLVTALGHYRSELGARIEASQNELAETAKQLKSAKVKKALEQIPGASELASAVESATKSAQAEAADAMEHVRKELEGLDGDLKKLLAQLP